MAEVCAFCGTELKRFGKDTLVCASITQTVCKDCWTRYRDATQIERCRDILKHSWAKEPEEIRTFLEEREQEKAREQAKAEKLGRLMKCCGQPMTPLGMSEFQLGRTSWIFGDWPNLLAGAMELALFRCECCGQIKFMDPKFMKRKLEEP